VFEVSLLPLWKPVIHYWLPLSFYIRQHLDLWPYTISISEVFLAGRHLSLTLSFPSSPKYVDQTIEVVVISTRSCALNYIISPQKSPCRKAVIYIWGRILCLINVCSFLESLFVWPPKYFVAWLLQKYTRPSQINFLLEKEWKNKFTGNVNHICKGKIIKFSDISFLEWYSLYVGRPIQYHHWIPRDLAFWTEGCCELLVYIHIEVCIT